MKISIHLTEIQYLIGAYEPTDAECDWPSDDDDELAEEIKDKVRYAHFHQANCNHVSLKKQWMLKRILYFHLSHICRDFGVRWECNIKAFITNQVLFLVKSGKMKST